MATLHHFTLFPPTFTTPAPRPPPPTTVALAAAPYPRRARGHRADRCRGACGYMVVVEHGGGRAELEVGPEETVLEKALDAGMEVPHDCKLGVCMTCPARLLNGAVDQSEGMLSDDVVSRGYALLCVSYPRSDCHIRTIPEEELLSLQLATAND